MCRVENGGLSVTDSMKRNRERSLPLRPEVAAKAVCTVRFEDRSGTLCLFVPSAHFATVLEAIGISDDMRRCCTQGKR